MLVIRDIGLIFSLYFYAIPIACMCSAGRQALHSIYLTNVGFNSTSIFSHFRPINVTLPAPLSFLGSYSTSRW